MKKVWFKAKRYGWGWYPATWQGWLILLAFGVIITAMSFVFEKDATNFLWEYLTFVFVCSCILIFICYKTGEKAEWRWGDKK